MACHLENHDGLNLKILVLDDDAFILKMVRHLLLQLGYQNLHLFMSAKEALNDYDQVAAPELILLDINMPDMDGIEFIRQLKDRKYSGALVLLSGEDELMHQTLIKLASLQGLNILGSLHKPVSQFSLKKILEKVVMFRCERLEFQTYQSRRKQFTIEEIQDGLIKGQFENYYQPKVNLQTGEWIGVECLIRWNHPTEGLVLPDQFIPEVEQKDHITELTKLVIDNAIEALLQWKLENNLHRIAINLSMIDISKVDFSDYVIEKITHYGLSPKNIVFEVTESCLMENLATVLDVLARLRLKRFQLSIDDFGTGHSSLVQLRDLPFDELKIDRGFVHHAYEDKRLANILKATLSLAQYLEMRVVAEGIETLEDWRYLQVNGCDIAQGYFIGHPMPLDQLSHWHQNWQVRCQEEGLLPSSDSLDLLGS